jgi:thioredoxin reductase
MKSDVGGDAGPDVAVVGGGPAGLSSALLLGRMGRRVVIIDAGTGRNNRAPVLSGFLGVDGLSPAEFRAAAGKQLADYPQVTFREGTVASIESHPGQFRVLLSDGSRLTARRLVLATGVSDELPGIDGLAGAWGTGVYSCAYCHGWERREGPLAVSGEDVRKAIGAAIQLRNLTEKVFLIMEGEPSANQRETLRRFGVQVVVAAVASVRPLRPGTLGVQLTGQPDLELSALFVATGQKPHSELAARLGCALSDDQRIRVNQAGHTSVTGVFAAGDVTSTDPLPSQMIKAAAAGTQVGIAIDQDLLMSDIDQVVREVRQAAATASGPHDGSAAR